MPRRRKAIAVLRPAIPAPRIVKVCFSMVNACRLMMQSSAQGKGLPFTYVKKCREGRLLLSAADPAEAHLGNAEEGGQVLERNAIGDAGMSFLEFGIALRRREESD